MASRIGVNVLLSHVKDYNGMLTRLKALQPTMIVATVDGDNDMARIHDLRRELAHTMVIGRVWHPQDGAYHSKPHDTRYWLASPDDFLNRWGELGKNGGVLYALNEPGTNIDDVTMTRLVGWTCETIKLANVRGIRLCVLNLATGHPNLVNGEWDKRFDPVLELLSMYRQHMAGTHEYKPDAGQIGRVHSLIARCVTKGIPVPQIAITEAGWDKGIETPHLNGYRSRGISGETFARQMLDVWKGTYAAHPEIVGMAVFCYGDNGQWSAFNVEGESAFFDTLIANPLPTPTLPPPPVPVPLPPPAPPKPDLTGLDTVDALLVEQQAKLEAEMKDVADRLAAIHRRLSQVKDARQILANLTLGDAA